MWWASGIISQDRSGVARAVSPSQETTQAINSIDRDCFAGAGAREGWGATLIRDVERVSCVVWCLWSAIIARRSLAHEYVFSGIESSFDGDVGTSIAREALTVHPGILACLIRKGSVSWAEVDQKFYKRCLRESRG